MANSLVLFMYIIQRVVLSPGVYVYFMKAPQVSHSLRRVIFARKKQKNTTAYARSHASMRTLYLCLRNYAPREADNAPLKHSRMDTQTHKHAYMHRKTTEPSAPGRAVSAGRGIWSLRKGQPCPGIGQFWEGGEREGGREGWWWGCQEVCKPALCLSLCY